jgi:hypothetical protein
MEDDKWLGNIVTCAVVIVIVIASYRAGQVNAINKVMQLIESEKNVSSDNISLESLKIDVEKIVR